jgi:hypothetical protein
LSAENADLAAASSSLKAENEALASRADSLLERQAALESAAESLKLENCTLLQQFDQLKLQYHQEASGFQEQVGTVPLVPPLLLQPGLPMHSADCGMWCAHGHKRCSSLTAALQILSLQALVHACLFALVFPRPLVMLQVHPSPAHFTSQIPTHLPLLRWLSSSLL